MIDMSKWTAGMQQPAAGKTWVRYGLTDFHIELYFDHIPDYVIRETLKTYYWRWDSAKRCWTGRRSPENLELAKTICKSLNPKIEDPEITRLQSLPRSQFTEYSLMIRSNSLYCNAHHDLEDMAGQINVCDRKGNIFTYLIPIVYCKTCGLYFALEGTYRNLKKHGHILCQVITYTDFKKNGAPTAYSGSLQSESLLHALGYNVSQSDGLTRDQRHVILERVIDSGILTKDRVLSYLDFFIGMRGDCTAAVEKWTEDRDYIADYQLGSNPKIPIGRIITLEHI